MRSHGAHSFLHVFKKLPQWRLIAVVLLFLPSLLISSPPAKADWWDPRYPGTNHGPDYWGAACAQMFEDYAVNCQFAIGFSYYHGQPDIFEVGWLDLSWPYWSLSGYASNNCPSGTIY